MKDEFQILKNIIENETINEYLNFDDWQESCHRRLLKALKNFYGKKNTEVPDIICLIRHCLRREDEKQGNKSSAFIKVPRSKPYPQKRKTWEKYSLQIIKEESNYFLISADYWQPNWLKNTDKYYPDLPIFAEEDRRYYQEIEGDPFLQLVGLKNYRSAAQREVIRSVLTAPDNSTLVINLPTGSGKSLCVQLPALLKSVQTGVSIVIVPTTALALDQERALAKFIPHTTAYYGDESLQGKQRRANIRERIRLGTQRIVFTSPESLISSLASCLYEAGQMGLIRYFAIDEAHMVEQWGDEFRPVFQAIAGLRRDLLRLTSFQTILLTATLTESSLDTLETLFAESGNFQVISAVQLRPEPSFWVSWCDSDNTRKERLLEALFNLPRPLIIYTSKQDDVKKWQQELSEAGFKRFSTMTGKSSTEERAKLIEDWRQEKIDIVIATSAFGLGVDQADIRAVIHLCIPETIDRFYQEVGRGGRDGKASISLTLYTKEDYRIARDLNEKSTITVDRGIQRWENMFNQKEIVENGKYRVNINLPPSYAEGDIDMSSSQNRNWNIRTLNLMARGGLIQLDSQSPPDRKNFNDDKIFFDALDSYYNSYLIEIKNEYHLSRETWDNVIEPIRLQRQEYSRHSLELMQETLKPKKRCLGEIFREAYYIPSRKIPPRKSVNVSMSCGGCEFCRQQNKTPFTGVLPTPSKVWQQTNFSLGGELEKRFINKNLILIFYESFDDKKWQRRLNKLIRWLINQGISNVVISPELKEKIIKLMEINSENIIFLFEKYEPIKMPLIPTLILLREGEFSQSVIKDNFSAPRLILLPKDTPYLETINQTMFNDEVKLIDKFNGLYYHFDTFLTEVGI